MRQKYSVNIADIQMNIVCEETQETVDAAVKALNDQIKALTTSFGHACTRVEAAMLVALDAVSKNIHMEERTKEMESFLHRADPTGDNFEASLLRGENEALRAELALKQGGQDALLQDNTTLFRLNAKLTRLNADANARADRMHDQVVSILSEVRDLRAKLAAMCVETREPSAAYFSYEEAPELELSDEELAVTQKYEQSDATDNYDGSSYRQ